MRVIAGAIVAGAAAMAVACSGSNSGNGSTSVADRAGTERARATLMGCLKNGDEAGTYILEMASASEVATPGTASSTPSSAGGATGEPIYRVVADKADDLAEHVNQRVAVNGYVESGTIVTATGTGGMRSNTTSSGYGSPNIQASPNTIGHGTSSQTGTDNGSVGTSGSVATGSGTVDRVDKNRSTEPTSGGGITQGNTGSGMQTLRAESVRKISDSCGQVQ